MCCGYWAAAGRRGYCLGTLLGIVGGAAAPVRSACAGASVDKRVRQLRRGPAPCRRASCPVPGSGQHSFIGGGLLPVTPPPASGSFAGGNGASPCPPVRTGFAEAGGTRRLPPPANWVWTEEKTRPPPQLRPTFSHRRRTITGNRYSGERIFRRRNWRLTLSSC